MPTNRRRHANAVPLAKFATGLIIGAFFCVAGLYYVWCKNELYSTGTQIKNLERELLDLQSKNEVVRSKIAQLTSTATLQARFDSGFIKLVPITNDRIANTSDKTAPASRSELRPVANERMQE